MSVQQRWYRQNKDAVKDRLYRNKYGITLAEYHARCESQAQQCAICGQREKLVVDHDHTTGEVRGLLCGNCNIGIGYFADEPDRLREAIGYIETYRLSVAYRKHTA